ncbi:MAG: hypothetical protein IPJ88_04025 [Myxococcales bacterium]|nr:MAG: hypothetical protein IPJ88_04025 [Myxococcales bacterium]
MKRVILEGVVMFVSCFSLVSCTAELDDELSGGGDAQTLLPIPFTVDEPVQVFALISQNGKINGETGDSPQLTAPNGQPIRFQLEQSEEGVFLNLLSALQLSGERLDTTFSTQRLGPFTKSTSCTFEASTPISIDDFYYLAVRISPENCNSECNFNLLDTNTINISFLMLRKEGEQDVQYTSAGSRLPLLERGCQYAEADWQASGCIEPGTDLGELDAGGEGEEKTFCTVFSGPGQEHCFDFR